MAHADLVALVERARRIAWTRWEAVLRVSSIDGVHWQASAIDAETAQPIEGAPLACDVSPEGAVDLWLAVVEAPAELTAPRTLAGAIPTVRIDAREVA